MNKLEIENGKYQIENNNGIVKVYRYGELWLDGVTKFELCLIQRIEELEQQNKRYREYLELIKTIGTYGKDISTGEIIRSNEANLAEEALEGEE